MKTMTIITITRLCNIGYISLFMGLTAIITGCKTDSKSSDENGFKTAIVVHPISHASLIMEYEDLVVYVDPVGDTESY